MKKHIFIRIIAALFYVVLSGLSGSGSLAQSSDWTELPLPGSGAVSALYAGNGVLLAARKADSQNAGVYRSEDRGQMWNPAPAFELGTDGSAVNCFVAVGNILYACARGVYRSTDKGQTWTPLNNGLRLSSDPNLIPPIGFIAVSGDLMVAAATAPHQAVFLSTDGGQNWAERNSGLAIGTNFIYGPATIRNGEFHLWVRSQLYRYQSGQQAWVQIGGAPRERSDFIVTAQSYFIIGRESNQSARVFRSDDSGLSWKGFSRGLPMNQIEGFSRIFALTQDGPFLYASATGGRNLTMPSATVQGNIYASDDGGETWGAATRPFSLSALQVDVDAPGLLSPIAASGADAFAASEGKLYRATMNSPVVSRPVTAVSIFAPRA